MTLAAIWGASGFVGTALCGAAEAAGWRVRRLQRRAGTDSVALAFTATDSEMLAALRGVEIAYHCAGKANEDDPMGYAGAAERFARGCAAAGVRRLVYLSTVAVYGAGRPAGAFDCRSPLAGTGAYVESRIEAERRLLGTLSASATRPLIVRVPMIVGQGMHGRALERFFGVIRWGIFPHPGPLEAVLACLGVRRLATILARLGTAQLPEPGFIFQYADHIRWVDLARRYGELRGKRIVRIPLPAARGRLAVLASTVRYADDSKASSFAWKDLPATWEDVDTLIRR